MSLIAPLAQPQAGVDRLLRQHTRAHPEQIAVREFRNGQLEERTFKELDHLVDQTCHALIQRGIRRGMRTVLMVPPGREFLACTFALLRIGAPPVLVDPGLGISGLKSCLDRARPEAFVGVSKAHWARVLLGWSRSTIQHRFGVGEGPFPPGTYHLTDLRKKIPSMVPYEGPVLDRDELAAILFTSGSTGPAKGAMAHHGQLEAQVEALARCHQLSPGEVDLPTFPLFGLFGVAIGMTSVVPVMDFTKPAKADPQHLLDLIKNFKVTNLFASPALLKSLSDYLHTSGQKIEGLRRIISAGAPARHEEIERLAMHVTAETAIETPYGATEGLPLCHTSHQKILETRDHTLAGEGVYIGAPVAEVQMQIVEPSGNPEDQPLPTDTVGEIWVTGSTVSRGYLFDESANHDHKYLDSSGRIWHRTGDIGTRDQNGDIWFRGRTSQRIHTAHGPIDTVATERMFEGHQGVFRTALVGVGPYGSQRPILCVEPDPTTKIPHQQIRDELTTLAKQNPLTTLIEAIVITGPFPVDIRHNAKIQREVLATRLGGYLS